MYLYSATSAGWTPNVVLYNKFNTSIQVGRFGLELQQYMEGLDKNHLWNVKGG